MKFAVDRLWQYYFAESAGKIRSKAEGGAGRRKYSQKRVEYKPRRQQSKRHLHRSRQTEGAGAGLREEKGR